MQPNLLLHVLVSELAVYINQAPHAQKRQFRAAIAQSIAIWTKDQTLAIHERSGSAYKLTIARGLSLTPKVMIADLENILEGRSRNLFILFYLTRKVFDFKHFFVTFY